MPTSQVFFWRMVGGGCTELWIAPVCILGCTFTAQIMEFMRQANPIVFGSVYNQRSEVLSVKGHCLPPDVPPG